MLNSRIIRVVAGSLTALALVSGGATVLAANGHAGVQAAPASAVTPFAAPAELQVSNTTVATGTPAGVSPMPVATSRPTSAPVRHMAATRTMTTTHATHMVHAATTSTHHAENAGCAGGHH